MKYKKETKNDVFSQNIEVVSLMFVILSYQISINIKFNIFNYYNYGTENSSFGE